MKPASVLVARPHNFDCAPMRHVNLRERAWWLLRKERVCTMQTLLDTLAEPHHRGAQNNLAKYLRALLKAGYVQSRGMGLETEYSLLRNSGCAAPLWREAKGLVTDPNTAEVYVIGDADA